MKPEQSALKEIAGKITLQNGIFFTQKSKFSKLHCYIKYSKNESKIKNHPTHKFLTKDKLQSKIILSVDPYFNKLQSNLQSNSAILYNIGLRTMLEWKMF